MHSKCGEGAGLLKRLQDEGNNCLLCIQEDDYSNVYDGILEKGDYPQNNAIVIFDSSGNGLWANTLKKQGFKVFSSSSFHDKLENDREFGLDFMESHGIMIPETRNFKKFSDGIKFVKENKKKRYVFKPSGKSLPCKLTYSCSDTEDLIIYMNFVEQNFGKDIDNFVLQEFIEGSIISSEFWVGKEGFIPGSFNHTIEVKKFMNDDLGPSTGCAGNIVWSCCEESFIAQTMKNIEESLIKEEFIGPIDLNCIVNEEGAFGLEWTPRFGLDAFPTLMQVLDQDLGKLISDSFESKNNMEMMTCFAGGARLSIPPYPIEVMGSLKKIEKDSPSLGIPIRGFEKCEDNCYFFEVMKQDDLLVHSSGTGVIACISDIGTTPKECFKEVYKILDECKIPDKQFRTDLAETLSDMHEEVEQALDMKGVYV